MTPRTLLRCWLAWLRAMRGPSMPLPVVLALPSPVLPSLEAVWSFPTVEPDISGYERPALDDVAAVTTWMVYERSGAWWGAEPAQVRHAAVYWLAMRERVTGVRIS